MSKSTRGQLDDLLARHAQAREDGSGWTGLPQDIAAMAAALASLESVVRR